MSKSVKNHRNLFQFFFHWKICQFGAHFLIKYTRATSFSKRMPNFRHPPIGSIKRHEVLGGGKKWDMSFLGPSKDMRFQGGRVHQKSTQELYFQDQGQWRHLSWDCKHSATQVRRCQTLFEWSLVFYIFWHLLASFQTSYWLPFFSFCFFMKSQIQHRKWGPWINILPNLLGCKQALYLL